MQLTPANVGRTVAARLVLAWAALSVLAGAAALYFEVGRVSRTVAALARSEAEGFTRHLGAIGPQHEAALRAQATQFLEGGFVALRLYDARNEPVLEAADAGRAADLREHMRALPPGGAGLHEMRWREGRLLMRLVVPLAGPQGLRGRFDGLYEVDAPTLAEIRAGVGRSLALTLGAVLATAAVLYSVIGALTRRLARLSADLLQSNLELMEVLGSAIALRDSATDAHNYRVTAYAIAMGEALRLPGAELRDLIAGAFLHDVGKIGVPDAVLLKPGALTPEEMQAMRRHVPLGAGVIAGSPWLRGARAVVECHHEKFDGSGYPQGLAGGAIPLGARIFAIVDAFDALTSRRPYKEALAFDAAMALLERGRGTHFEPALLDAFRGVAAAVHGRIGTTDEAGLRRSVRRQAMEHFRLAAARAAV